MVAHHQSHCLSKLLNYKYFSVVFKRHYSQSYSLFQGHLFSSISPLIGTKPRGQVIFNINDDFNRESMKIEIDTSLPSARVIRALDDLVELRGAPRRLRLDNGPEFISAALKDWAARHAVELIHIQPGKPTQNAYIECFNRTFRTEVLDRFVFTTLDEVRRMAEDWRHRYNHQRPHRSLGGLPPIRFAMAQSPTPSTSE